MVAEKLSNFKVANLSVIGVGMDGLIDFITCPLTGQLKPNVVVVEIPLVDLLVGIKVSNGEKIRKCADYSSGGMSYWQLVALRPYGLGWVSLLWDKEAYDKRDEDIVITPLPPTYFASAEQFEAIHSQYEIELVEYLNSVSTMGEKVLVYVSPIYTPGIGMSGGDQSAVELQIQLTYDICKKMRR